MNISDFYHAVKRGITCQNNEKCARATEIYRSSMNQVGNLEYCSQDEEKLFSSATWPVAPLFLLSSSHRRYTRLAIEKIGPLPRAGEQYIKTVITGMRSFIALRRRKRRGPRRTGNWGCSLGILELADKRAVCASSLVRFYDSLLAPSLRFSPRRSFSLSSVPRVFGASIETLFDVSLLSCSSSTSSSPPARPRCTLSLIAGIYQMSK